MKGGGGDEGDVWCLLHVNVNSVYVFNCFPISKQFKLLAWVITMSE